MNLNDLDFAGLPIDKILLVIIIALVSIIISKAVSLYITRVLKKRMTLDHAKMVSKGAYFMDSTSFKKL